KDKENTRQNQNIAISADGIHFEKFAENPVLTEKDIPAGSSITDFRDPKIFERAGQYYCVIGSKTLDDQGQVLLYQSDNLLEWTFVSVVFPHNKYLGKMVECPDLLLFAEKAVFILSAMDYVDEKGVYYSHISWLIEGEMDWDYFKFHQTSIKEMDKGLDYYAPQTVKLDKDSYWTIAWMQNWQADRLTNDLGHQWLGQMTLPRMLEVKESHLKQKAPQEILNKIQWLEEYENGHTVFFGKSNVLFLKLAAAKSFVLQFENDEEAMLLNYSATDKTLSFSRQKTHLQIKNTKNELLNTSRQVSVNTEFMNLLIFLDRSSFEIFVNQEETITSTFYPQKSLRYLTVTSDDKVSFEKLCLGKLCYDS
ncbi:MAG TPA: GH32 C-terminal domain-containing protein, partial [Tetragenococcus sp.]|nr:GH32 C-terminal domain-containing protein [Tetragenococcus sp.]